MTTITYKAISWAWRRFRPQEGWLSVALILALTGVIASQVNVARWVPEGSIVWIALMGLVMALVLAKRPLGWLTAWAILVLYGLSVTTLWLARLWPTVDIVLAGWSPTADHIRQNWGLFLDRVGGWLAAVFDGGSSQETVVFAFGLGLLAWILGAYAAWCTFRLGRPLAGVMAIGLALAVNGYYGRVSLEPVALFVGLATLLVATVHFANLERTWEAKGIDYSAEIRLELLTASAGIALILFVFAYLVPAVNWDTLSRLVLNRPAIYQAEETFGRAFAGVRQPEKDQIRVEPVDGSQSAGGEFPRSYLLGDLPELSETVVMTAMVRKTYSTITHWRGLSYDIYTGRGWSLSPEREESVVAKQPIPIPEEEQQAELNQSINWVFGESTMRYTLGLPFQFDHSVASFWRGRDDLSRVRGEGNHYSATSRISIAPADQLRRAALSDVPPAIMARYTKLPESLPERIRELAQEVVANPQVLSSPYDQAKALERFLRQYPYSLEVELPPAGTDPVEYFLFDSQSGYCDYYASSMVVMARTLGLPARLAAGFLAQPADENGTQTIYQINGHSWAEIYFAGYGWVEFEPTAAFPSEQDNNIEGMEAATGPEISNQQYIPPPIPEKDHSPWPIFLLLISLALIIVGWLFWRRRAHVSKADGIIWAYDRLWQRAIKLGQPTSPSQTPNEFETSFFDLLEKIDQRPLVRRLKVARLYPDIKWVTASFVARQYSPQKPESRPAVDSWKRVRLRLWILGFLMKTSQIMYRDKE